MANKISQELYVGIGILVLSILAYFFAIPIGIVVPDGVDIRALSPDFWPGIIVIVLGVAGLSLVIQGLASMGMLPGKGNSGLAAGPDNDPAPETQELSIKKAALRVTVFVSTLFAIYFAIPLIGMVASTIPAIMFLAWYAGERRWKIILSLSIALPLLLYFFFVYVANVPIPTGIFESLGG